MSSSYFVVGDFKRQHKPPQLIQRLRPGRKRVEAFPDLHSQPRQHPLQPPLRFHVLLRVIAEQFPRVRGKLGQLERKINRGNSQRRVQAGGIFQSGGNALVASEPGSFRGLQSRGTCLFPTPHIHRVYAPPTCSIRAALLTTRGRHPATVSRLRYRVQTPRAASFFRRHLLRRLLSLPLFGRRRLGRL